MKKILALALASALVLVACGGSDNTPPPPTAQVPASASQTVGGFIAYLQALIASAADMLEPVDVSTVTPPTDDTIEPQTVD
ncbi:MAG TPA: hypothetical protein VMU47_08625 [Caldimonas sp.]|nr:hypothetical protein [Caldimonas sp.]